MRIFRYVCQLLLLFGVCEGLVGCSTRSHARGEFDCAFIPVQEATDEVTDCAYRDTKGDLFIRKSALRAAYFRKNGLASVMVGNTLYYVNPKGRTAPTIFFDNGADYFVGGLARTQRDGKIGFINSALDEVIKPAWDFAFPFEDGLSMVCQGCVSLRVVGSEYSEMVGGKWGFIDKKGQVVVPVIYEKADLPSRRTLTVR